MHSSTVKFLNLLERDDLLLAVTAFTAAEVTEVDRYIFRYLFFTFTSAIAVIVKIKRSSAL
jgi:hypothetical protein